MYSFANDYSEGAHESVLEFLHKVNKEQLSGYSEDIYCDAVRNIISDLTGGCPAENIHFLNGGTQTNTAVITAFLRPHQGVISPDTGHINTHEAGAVEGTGHRVIALASKEGKITAEQVQQVLIAHEKDPTAAHSVQPGMVYISQPTEIGTVYTKKELEDISFICRKFHIPFYIDGARLGCALASKKANFTIKDLFDLTDAFYIGGTKNGALMGELLIIADPVLNKDFSYIHKQRGGRLAKGWLIGVQFLCLLQENLYLNLASHANKTAELLYQGLKEKGVRFLAPLETNQIFPILPAEQVEKLEKEFLFHRWGETQDGQIIFRLCTSWATPQNAVDAFLSKV